MFFLHNLIFCFRNCKTFIFASVWFERNNNTTKTSIPVIGQRAQHWALIGQRGVTQRSDNINHILDCKSFPTLCFCLLETLGQHTLSYILCMQDTKF